jgi:hypothetical protein
LCRPLKSLRQRQMAAAPPAILHASRQISREILPDGQISMRASLYDQRDARKSCQVSLLDGLCLWDRARDASTAQTATSGRILGKILLMIVFRIVEFGCLKDLRGDLATTRDAERLLVGVTALLCGSLLFGRKRVYARAVGGANIIALAHALCWIMLFPEQRQEFVIGDDVRVEHHQMP